MLDDDVTVVDCARSSGVLLPEVTLFVHPIDTLRHPTSPPGWRWAVHAGGGPPGDLRRCTNAGWCPDEKAALGEGEQNAATAVQAVRVFGVPAALRVLRLQSDPIPAGEDRVRLLRNEV